MAFFNCHIALILKINVQNSNYFLNIA